MISCNTYYLTVPKNIAAAMAAYETWHEQNRRVNKRYYHWLCKKFIEFAGTMPVSNLTEKVANDYILFLINDKKNYSFDTVRLCVTAPQAMIEFLRDSGDWHGENPFNRQLKKYGNRFAAVEPVNPMFSNDEWNRIFYLLNKPEYWSARIFIEVSRTTGLRPSEVRNLNTKHLDRNNLSWGVLVTKTAHRPMFRRIAIPQVLETFVTNENLVGRLPLSEATVKKQIGKLSEETRIEIVPKRFRKDFACRMEAIGGAEASIINLHQGRAQSGVLYKNYITDPDRAVELCRVYVDRMFSGNRAELSLVR